MTLKKPWTKSMLNKSKPLWLRGSSPKKLRLGLLRAQFKGRLWDRESFSVWAFSFIHTRPSVGCVRIRKLWRKQYFPHSWKEELYSQSISLRRLQKLTFIKFEDQQKCKPPRCPVSWLQSCVKGLSAIWAS